MKKETPTEEFEEKIPTLTPIAEIKKRNSKK
jgi:hypothetical protein